MKILILGGLSFLGRHLIEIGLSRGHVITTFTRGKRNADMYPEVEKLIGDRDGDLRALEGRSWDVAIDTSGYLPRVVRDSARLLAPSLEHYTFVSSLSVYADNATPWQDENAPVETLDGASPDEFVIEKYGALKALCEAAAEAEMPGRTLIVRPGLIVGKYDPTDRFTYWPYRVSRGGEVLAPPAEDPMQIIDAHDLAAWMLTMAEQRKTGVYNVTGPQEPLTVRAVLETCQSVSGSDASLTYVSSSFLEEQGVQPWQDLPSWVPDTEEMRGFSRTDVRRAVAAGLRFRPLADTVRDTLEWANEFPPDHEWQAGLTPERERQVLDAWHKMK